MSDHDTKFRALYRDLRIADQERYYKDRSTEYDLAHRQAIIFRNVFLIAAALAGVSAQFTSGIGRAGCGVAAALLAALASAVTAFDALIGFPQLQKLYDDAALNLAVAAVDWDSAGTGDKRAGIERVEKIMRSENGQWGQLAIKNVSKGGETTADLLRYDG
jgi:SMODS and SLOG-associating 2TM effector domain 1